MEQLPSTMRSGASLPDLLKDFQVIHLCGKGKLDASLNGTEGYVQYEYIQDELADLFALADICVSRAGANAICELLALRKPALLIPLSANASRGDQILNADSFKRQGFCEVLKEEELTPSLLVDTVQKLYQNRQTYIHAMENSRQSDGISAVIKLINDASGLTV